MDFLEFKDGSIEALTYSKYNVQTYTMYFEASLTYSGTTLYNLTNIFVINVTNVNETCNVTELTAPSLLSNP